MSVQFDDATRDKLDALRKKEEEELIVVLSKKYGLPSANLLQVQIGTEALAILTEKTAREAEIAAFDLSGKILKVGIRTPNNPQTQRELEELSKRGFKVVPHMVSSTSLEHAWARYKDVSFAVETESGMIDVSGSEIKALKEQLLTLETTRQALIEALGMKKLHRITRILEILLAGALSRGASDIHVEPEEENVRVRYRLDGVLTNIATLDHDTYNSMITRVKLLSGLKINIKNVAQDGRFSVRVEDREIDIRTSVLPGGYGESIVMRLLDPHSIGLSLEQLGMRPQIMEIIARELEKPNGMILNTGPTGSGKTTTLYAFLKKVLDPGIKILTIEDPIEYHLAGVVQTQVDRKGYTFGTGLRSALRQDPDIIMVGEIRDEEVASTAIHAALTGHLVFSTLHTNNAAGAYPRLIDIGVDPSMVGSAVNMVMAQRLLRTLDPAHTREVPIEGEDKVFIDRVLAGISDRSLVPKDVRTMRVPDAPLGETGYRGRVGVYEAICTTRDIEQAIRSNLTIRELEDVARKQGFLSMHEDAILKVLEGVTSLEEVRRILGESITTSI